MMADEALEVPPELAEKLTEAGEKLQSIDISGGDIIFAAIVLIFFSGIFFSLIGLVMDFFFMMIESIFWAIKWFFKGLWWVLCRIVEGVDWSITTVVERKRQSERKKYDSPGVVGTSQCILDDKQEVKKGKRSNLFKIADEGDIFDGADDFSDFD